MLKMLFILIGIALFVGAITIKLKMEKEYKEAGLDNPDLGREELIAAMIEHPRLIERPIVITNGKAAIGRPPEKVLEIL